MHVSGEEWALRGHCGRAKGQEEGVPGHPTWVSTSYRPPSVRACWGAHACSQPPSLHPCVLRSSPRQNASQSQPSCNSLWRNMDFWGPCFLLRSNSAICMLEKYWQPSDLSYLFKALPHGNAALLYWGEVCVLFNSERQAPRIACKINVNQL